MTNKPKYKVGMVGCGRQGTQHARGFTLNPLTEVVAIADPVVPPLGQPVPDLGRAWRVLREVGGGVVGHDGDPYSTPAWKRW